MIDIEICQLSPQHEIREIRRRPVRRVIEERDVPLPNDWTHFMELSDNKADYARFLPEELIMQAPEGKEIVVSGEFVDELDIHSSKTSSNFNHLKSNQEEVGTRIILHAVNYNCHALIVPCDVLALLALYFYKMHYNELWVKARTSKNRKYIPVHEIVNHIPPYIIPALIPFHAITGCGTTSCISGHTKLTAWKILIDIELNIIF